MSKPRAQKVLDQISCSLAIVMFVCGVVWVISYLLQSPGTADFQIHRARYDKIISTAKAMGIAPGGSSHFWITSELVPVPPGRQLKHNDMKGMVDVFRNDTGAYQVSIVTRDEGTSGTFGYLFADGELAFPDNVTGLTSVQRQLNSHWWTGFGGKW